MYIALLMYPEIYNQLNHIENKNEKLTLVTQSTHALGLFLAATCKDKNCTTASADKEMTQLLSAATQFINYNSRAWLNGRAVASNIKFIFNMRF